MGMDSVVLVGRHQIPDEVVLDEVDAVDAVAVEGWQATCRVVGFRIDFEVDSGMDGPGAVVVVPLAKIMMAVDLESRKVMSSAPMQSTRVVA